MDIANDNEHTDSYLDQCLAFDKNGPTWICSSISADERSPTGIFSDCAAMIWHKATRTTNKMAYTRLMTAISNAARTIKSNRQCGLASCTLLVLNGRSEVER